MNDYMKTIVSGLKQYMNKHKSDWNQNDSSAPSYVKNRTHYSEYKDSIEYIVKDLTFEAWYDDYYGTYKYESDGKFITRVADTYTVIFDGVEYTCKSNQPLSDDEDYISDGFGNSGLFGEEDTGEPFFIYYEAESYYSGDLTITCLEGGSHTITIYNSGIKEIVHKIDGKYLPKSIGGAGTGKYSEIFNSDYNTAEGDYSHAEGDYTTASGDYSHAEGDYTTASGDYSHAEGNDTTASGSSAHAEGNETTASGYASHAEGNDTTASGDYSHAEGNGTTASGGYSHAEGEMTEANGYFSHAEGINSIADGDSSHAEGDGTQAFGECQHVQGKYNIEDAENKYAHIVGNGNSNRTRSNAHTVDWDGNAWFAGDVYIGSTSGTNRDDGSKKLATMDDITTLVGDTPVATQIETAIAGKFAAQILTWEADD